MSNRLYCSTFNVGLVSKEERELLPRDTFLTFVSGEDPRVLAATRDDARALRDKITEWLREADCTHETSFIAPVEGRVIRICGDCQAESPLVDTHEPSSFGPSDDGQTFGRKPRS